LGKPINDSYNQTAIHVSMNGVVGYFSSQDTTTYQLDIHEFTLPDFIKPNPVAYIAGTVRDANNKQPLAAKISVTNTASQDIVFEDQSDEQDGKFIATLPIGQDYAVHVQREGYLFDSRQYDLQIRIWPTRNLLRKYCFQRSSRAIRPSSVMYISTQINIICYRPRRVTFNCS